MQSKRLLQIFVLLALLFSPMGSMQHASASTGPAPQSEAVVIDRNLNYWDADYFGYISSNVFENWRFEFTASHNFVVTVSRVTGDVVPMVILLDANGNELGRGTGSFSSTQPAGSYSFQVRPESGLGLYMLTLREIAAPSQPAVKTVVTPASISVGETAAVTVSLSDIPTDGYTSAEFTCTYNPSLVEVRNITLTDLFGIDPVMAATSPQNGSFILAVAGSNGQKAANGGTAFNFGLLGLQGGQSTVECQARISAGGGTLSALPSTPAGLTVLVPDNTATPTFTPTPVVSETPTAVETATPTSTPVDTATPPASDTPTSTPVESATPTSTPIDTATPTSTVVASDTPTFTVTPVESATPVASPTFTSTPVPTTGTLFGEVAAAKPVTIGLYDANNTLVTSVVTNDGSFTLTAPTGTYFVKATAPGFLAVAGSVTIAAGETTTLPPVALLAGDIDNNDVIDQFDAMTIGMSYNTAVPDAADLNADGVINVLDLELLARNYRAAGPNHW